MKHKARVLRLPAVMMLLALALPLTLALAAPTPDPTVDVDGVWGISEQGTGGQGASCDRWATGPGSSPSAISDTDPSIQSPPTKDENQIRYGAEDTEAAPCNLFANQSGFGFDGVHGASMPTDGTSFKLGTFIHYNGRVNVDHEGFNPLANVGLTITLSGSVDAVLEQIVTLDETVNDDVPCKYPDAPNTPPCGEKVTFASQLQTTIIAIEGKRYTLEILGLTDCDVPGTPSEIFYTQEQGCQQSLPVCKACRDDALTSHRELQKLKPNDNFARIHVLSATNGCPPMRSPLRKAQSLKHRSPFPLGGLPCIKEEE